MDNPKTPKVNLPYFDYLLDSLAQQDPDVTQSFGRHVHWGYWSKPRTALLTRADFAHATDRLSQQVCVAGKIAEKQVVLDVGCGFGGTLALINETQSNMTLHGLNIDNRQLQRAQKQVKPNPPNTLQFHQGNACALPYPDQVFDRVLAVECIFHFPDRAQFLKEAFRVLKPGGILSLSDFTPKKIIAPLMKITLPKPFDVGFYGHCRVDTPLHQYHALAKQTGFTTITEKNITDNTLPTYRYLRTMAAQQKQLHFTALIETLTIELLSRLHLLDYYILAYQKPKH